MTVRRKQVRELAKAAKQSLLIGSVAVLAAELARRLFRHMQLFCPERKPVKSWNPADYGVPPDRVEEQWFETPDGEMLYGWYCRAEKAVASVVYCHGNTGNLTNTAFVIPHLLDSGMNVLFFDYRGFGGSEGPKWRIMALEQIDDILVALVEHIIHAQMQRKIGEHAIRHRQIGVCRRMRSSCSAWRSDSSSSC